MQTFLAAQPALTAPSTTLPTFSVLIANYNHGALVGRAIDSVLLQDYPADCREVVVVDDGSTDDSVQRLQPYANQPGVRVLLQGNRGQMGAFAAALQAAKGDTVCLLDADDSFLPGKLRRLTEHLATLDTGPDSLFLCHDLQILDGADGPAIASTWFDVVNVRRFGPRLHVSAADQFFPFAVTSGMVFGAELLRQAMAEVPLWDWPMGADGVLGHVAMLLAGEVHYLPEALGCYVVHGDNNFAAIVNGQFRQKPVWHGRWAKKLRLLERVLDSLPLSERERSDRLAYLGRVEHAVRAVPSGRAHTQPRLSFIVDALEPGSAEHLDATLAAIRAQTVPHHEVVVLLDERDAAVRLGAGTAAGITWLGLSAGSTVYSRWRAGLQAASGAYLCLLQAGDLPDRRHTERHLQCHRYGTLPMLTVSDLRLLNHEGVVLHVGIQGTAQPGWGLVAAQVSPFSTSLRDWPLAPLPAMVFRRTPLLDSFFHPEQCSLGDRHVGWLLAHYLLQMGGATRLAENLMDLRLPPEATPNASWLAHFIDRHGPLPSPDLPACATLLFQAFARAQPSQRRFFSEGWELRFVRWLVQCGGADSLHRLTSAGRACSDPAWAERLLAPLLTPAPR